MTGVLLSVAAFLLVTLLLSLIRIWRGPEAADRMLASQLFCTTGVALLLVLAYAGSWPALMDVALTVAVLAVLAVAAFVTRVVRIDREAASGKSANAESREEPHV
ncbi:monovalent cation/H+ antiporter complex subunit F [Marinobacter pelagius]|uniref:monovalent cation/H+ antiporter complex subunit F n=1 Tax=Marinobacter sp. C7 TaxID=2951363 RepID=UPI001EF0F19A|nr:monovalent cation/H+ antiporter complex subunit F [Marinobacter sp. C7]MCG7199694.1 monovalent cation/H+ antiporter complex subunit F [Marinobacter sp. C7]